MPVADELAYLTLVLERALKARPKRSMVASPEELRPTLEAIQKAGPDKAPEGWTPIDPKRRAAVLPELRRIFNLSDAEAELLLVALGPELDARLRRVYGFLQDNMNRERAHLGFALDLLFATTQEKHDARRYLASDSTLRYFYLVQLGGNTGDATLGRELSAPERVVRAALGEPGIDDLLTGIARLDSAGVPLSQISNPPDNLANALDLLKKDQADRPVTVGAPMRPVIAIRGPAHAGKKHVARALMKELGRPMVIVDFSRLPKTNVDLPRILRIAARDALLLGAALYIDQADLFADPEALAEPPRPLLDLLARFPDVVFLGSTRRLHQLDQHREVLRMTCDMPSPDQRKQLWTRFLPADVQLGKDVDLDELSRKYSIGAGAIAAGAREAANAARMRGKPAEVKFGDLLDGARNQLVHKLGSIAERVTKTYRWEDLILPEEVIESLKEMVGFAKFRGTVYDKWGFLSKHAYGRGVSSLFWGPPGTGKTMVAGIMARELDMEIFRVDLSRVVSKWIGETEKNLAKVFDEATQSQAILLFDEADSLFAKRTEVKSSNDRYANLEVSFLLQRMEQYDGVSILTTNFEDTIDEAFKRRLQFRVEFPFPDIEFREKLWKVMVPKSVPIVDDIDWFHLAKRFDLAGGNIRNAVARAAFYAAEAGKPVDQSMLERAGTRESEETGKLVQHLSSAHYKRK